MNKRQVVTRILADHVAPAAIWSLLVYSNVLGIAAHLSGPVAAAELARLLSVAALNSLGMYLFLVRRPVRGARSSPAGALAALLGSFAPMFVGLFPVTTPRLVLVGTVVCCVGMIWSVISLASLGRCFGVLPEARGLVTSGPYSLVRHPLYFGHITMTLGLVLPALSVFSVLSWLALTGLQLWRASYEERALAIAFPEYATYQRHTRRIIPHVW